MRCKNVKNNFKMNFIKLIYTFSPKSGIFGYADENWKFWEKYKFEKEWKYKRGIILFWHFPQAIYDIWVSTYLHKQGMITCYLLNRSNSDKLGHQQVVVIH